MRACDLQNRIESTIGTDDLGLGSLHALVEAFDALHARPRVLHMPPQLLDAAAAMIRPFNRNASGFLRFFRTVATTEMVGPAVGDHSLAAFFRELAARDRPTPRAT